MKITCNIQVVVEYYTRALELPEPGTETFFLWGSRQCGKSTLLKHTYPDSEYIDLLKSEEFRRYTERPEVLRQEIEEGHIDFVIIDEIQKVPALLDEVHWLIENRGVSFALCGSSARKVRKGQANLLGGRGINFEMFGFSAWELGGDFDLVRLLNHGYLPSIYADKNPQRRLNTYVSLYLKEEIAAEGLVRRLPVYSDFLSMAALSDTGIVSYTTIARETGVSSETIRGYFDILCDTLLGRFLPAYRRRPKRRIVKAPKFYFSDVGVVNFLARRGEVRPGSELFGQAFENWIFHELCAYDAYHERFAEIHYWRLSSGIEVDFLINHIDCAVECKSGTRVTSTHLKGLRQLKLEHPETRRRIVVSMEPKNRRTDDGIEILSYRTFLERLWRGELF